MSLRDVYFAIEDKWYKFVDWLDGLGLPAHTVTNAIDKIMPSMILFFILFVIFVAIIVYFAIPSMQVVTLKFTQDGLPVMQDFNFALAVDGKEFSGIAIKGVASIKLPTGSEIKILSVDLKKYSISKLDFSFAENITVPLFRIYSKIPISIYLYDGTEHYSGDATASFSCSNNSVVLDSSIQNKNLSGGNFLIEVPENCGTLTINSSASGFKPNSTVCDSTTCQIFFESVSAIGDAGADSANYPTGSIRVNIKDESGVAQQGAEVIIYNVIDMQNAYDSRLTNEVGVAEFVNLPVGSYKIFANKSGYLMATYDVQIEENKKPDVFITQLLQNLGQVVFKFMAEDKNPVAGDFILYDSTGKIVHRQNTDENGLVYVPIYSYADYNFEFSPFNSEYLPLSLIKISFSSTSSNYSYILEKKTSFNSAHINIQVVDQYQKPIKGAKIYVRDSATSFELLAYQPEDTDSNGETSINLPAGIYTLRAYSGISEGYSETIAVENVEAGEMPTITSTIMIYYGTSIFNLSVVDEFDLPISFSKAAFYNKPRKCIGDLDSCDRVLDNEGKLNPPVSLNAGQYVYYKVSADGYLPYYSESRFIMPNEPWNAEVILTPNQDDEFADVKFMGVYKTLDGAKVYNVSAGQSYYVGYEIKVYNELEKDEFTFDFSTGEIDFDVEMDKFFITDVYTSADYDVRYKDFSKEQETESDTKVVNSKWQNVGEGVYRIFYKIQIKNDSSVKLYDQLKLSWVYNDDVDAHRTTGEDFLLVGAKSECTEDSFCARVSVLDLDQQLYVDSFEPGKYMLNQTRNYEIEYEIVNSLEGADGEISNGLLQIYNAKNKEDTFDTVKYNPSLYSFVKLISSEIDGPNIEFSTFVDERYGIFVSDYNFGKFQKNKYIHGKMTVSPVSKDSSVINYIIIDSDRKKIVRNEPALSLDLTSTPAKEMSVKIFPETVLAPEMTQEVKVTVTEENESAIYDARVMFRVKYPTDYSYKIYEPCMALKTDVEGKAYCYISAEDAKLGAFFQVQVEKEGYNSYYHLNFAPDLRVTDKILEFSPEKLEVNLSYPDITEAAADLQFTNTSAVDMTIAESDLTLDDYSLQYQGFLEFDAMRSYIKTIYQGKSIYGKEYDDESQSVSEQEAITNLKDFFKAQLNQASIAGLDEVMNASGFVTVSLRTNLGTKLDYDIPFNVQAVANGYPTNSGDCLRIGFLTDSLDGSAVFTSDGGKVLELSVDIINTCVIEGSGQVLPVKFDELYMLIGLKDGSYGTGQFSGLTIPNIGLSADAFALGLPKSLGSITTDLANPEYMGTLGFSPSGRQGKTVYTIKLIGFVNTSEGAQRVESLETEFTISVLNIEDCLKVYDIDADGVESETNRLTFAALDSEMIGQAIEGNDFKEFKLKNICEGIPLKYRVCTNNEGERSKGCGSLSGWPVAGLGFDDDSLEDVQGTDIVDEKTIKIKRPGVPGAYALDVWARLPEQASMKHVKELQVNVKTTLQSGLFSDNPFLEVHLVDGKDTEQILNDIAERCSANNGLNYDAYYDAYFCETVTAELSGIIYEQELNPKTVSDVFVLFNSNTGVGKPITLLNKETYKKLLYNSDPDCLGNFNEKNDVCFVSQEDIVNAAREGINVSGTEMGVARNVTNIGINSAMAAVGFAGVIDSTADSAINTSLGGTAASGVTLGVGLTLLATSIAFEIAAANIDAHNAAIMYTTGGAVAGAGGIIMTIAIFSVSACASGFGCILSAMSFFAASTTWMLSAVFMEHMQQSDETDYLYLENYSADPVFMSAGDSNYEMDVSKVISYIGEDKYLLISHYKQVEAETGMISKKWSDSLDFTEYCPEGYEIVDSAIYTLESDDDNPYKKGVVKFNHCSWQNERYVLNDLKDQITFKVQCGGDNYIGADLKTYAFTACKPRDELWSRMQVRGIDSGYPGTGMLKLMFTDVDYETFYNATEACDEEWCYKTYTLTEDSDSEEIFGNIEDSFRVAFHNDKQQAPETLSTGFACTDAAGNVIGFTGEDARPKVTYNWNFDTIENVDFCIPITTPDSNIKSAKTYCDATQFFASNYSRVFKGAHDVSELSEQLECPQYPPEYKINNDTEIVSDINALLGFSDPIIGPGGDSNNILQMSVALNTNGIVYSNEQMPTINAASYSNGKNLTVSCDSELWDTLGSSNTYTPICTIDLATFDLEGFTEDGSYPLFNANVVLSVSIDGITKVATINTKVDFVKFEGGCLLSNPSTEIVNGKLLLSQFLPDATPDSDLEKALFKIQDILHYQAYLMNDGLTLDFMKDYVTACDNGFLTCDATGINILRKMITENRINVVNVYNGSASTNGPGLYNIHNVITYPADSLGFDSNEVYLTVYLEKVKGPENDSLFYYMPVDGKVGIDGTTIDRQGYGVDFYGDPIKIFTNYTENVDTGLITGLDSTSNSLNTINVSRAFDFTTANRTKRGEVLEMTKFGNEINLLFTPDLATYKFDAIMSNKEINEDTVLFYSILYNGNRMPNNVISMPWYADLYYINNGITDFSGQQLIDTYPKTGMQATQSDNLGADYDYYAKLDYPAEEVIANSEYKIHTIVYARAGDSVQLNPILRNLEDTEIQNSAGTPVGIESLNDVLDKISDKNLCVGGNTINSFVFVNELCKIDPYACMWAQ